LHTPRDPPGKFFRRKVGMLFLFGQAHNVERELKSLEGQFQPASWCHRPPGRDLAWLQWF